MYILPALMAWYVRPFSLWYARMLLRSEASDSVTGCRGGCQQMPVLLLACWLGKLDRTHHLNGRIRVGLVLVRHL